MPSDTSPRPFILKLFAARLAVFSVIFLAVSILFRFMDDSHWSGTEGWWVKGRLPYTDRGSLILAYFGAFGAIFLTSRILIQRMHRTSGESFSDTFVKQVITGVKALDVLVVLVMMGSAQAFGWSYGDYVLRYYPFFYMPYLLFFSDAYSIYRSFAQCAPNAQKV